MKSITVRRGVTEATCVGRARGLGSPASRWSVWFIAAFVIGCGGQAAETADVEDLVSAGAPKAPPFDEQSFEEFKASHAVFLSDDPVYVVEGDIALTEQQLRRYYIEHYLGEEQKAIAATLDSTGELIRWLSPGQLQLNFCVAASGERAFPATGALSYNNVVTAMKEAAAMWHQVANVTITHTPTRDTDCPAVDGMHPPPAYGFNVGLFQVLSGDAEAISYEPNGCADFNSDCHSSQLTISASGSFPLGLTRTLAHELGHILGFFHEACAMPTSFRFAETAVALTAPDPDSIMVPSLGVCGGNPTVNLSRLDGIAARQLYGAPPAWVAALF